MSHSKRCSGCNAPIVFFRTAAGEWMPCDAELRDFVEDPAGDDTAYYGNAAAVRGYFVTGPCDGSVKAWRPHWAACGNPRKAAPAKAAAAAASKSSIRCGTGWAPGRALKEPKRRSAPAPAARGSAGNEQLCLDGFGRGRERFKDAGC